MPPGIKTIAVDAVDPTEGNKDWNQKQSPGAVCGGIRKKTKGIRIGDIFLETGGLAKTRLAGELPVSVRGALERVLADCMRGPDDWTWKTLYDAAEKQVRLHTKTREWTLGGCVGGANYAAHLLHQSRRSNPDKRDDDDSRRMLKFLMLWRNRHNITPLR